MFTCRREARDHRDGSSHAQVKKPNHGEATHVLNKFCTFIEPPSRSATLHRGIHGIITIRAHQMERNNNFCIFSGLLGTDMVCSVSTKPPRCLTHCQCAVLRRCPGFLCLCLCRRDPRSKIPLLCHHAVFSRGIMLLRPPLRLRVRRTSAGLSVRAPNQRPRSADGPRN